MKLVTRGLLLIVAVGSLIGCGQQQQQNPNYANTGYQYQQQQPYQTGYQGQYMNQYQNPYQNPYQYQQQYQNPYYRTW